MQKPRTTNEEVFEAHRETGSIWRAAERLGLTGQAVHARLVSAGYKVGNRWTENDVERLRALAPNMTISQLTESLGRSYAAIACKLNDIGASPKKRYEKKRKSKSDYEVRAETERHIKAIEAQSGHVTTYCRSVGINIETFARRAEKHFPDWWKEYREAHSKLDPTVCPGCSDSFTPFSAKQKYCTRKCREDSKVDAEYFGGRRSSALGFKQNKCILCHETKKNMNVHHVYGKENDPDNSGLVLLCSGCHQIVGQLGGREYSEEDWNTLVLLATSRRYGADLMANRAMRVEAHVEVRLVEYDEQTLLEEEEEYAELEKAGTASDFHHDDSPGSRDLVKQAGRNVAA